MSRRMTLPVACLIVLLCASTAFPEILFHIETVDTQDDAGLATSIAIDGQGRPHVAYIRRAVSGACPKKIRRARRCVQTVARNAGLTPQDFCAITTVALRFPNDAIMSESFY